MDDKCIMENLLLTTKGVCDLFMHGAVESSTANIHSTFENALNNAICMQNNIYNQMTSHGWYTEEQVQQQKIDQLRQKYNSFAG